LRPRAKRLPAHLLRRRREAVEEIGRDENEVQQNCIGGKLYIASRAPCAVKNAKAKAMPCCGQKYRD